MRDETKEKISKSMTNRPRRRKFQNMSGDVVWLYKDEEPPPGYLRVLHRFPEDTKKKMSEEAKARGAPPAAFRSKKGELNPMFGKKHSAESRWRISESLKRRHEQDVDIQ
jgi:hypothetical protein